MGINVLDQDAAAAALRMLERAPSLGAWPEGYYRPGATPSRPLADLSLSEIGNLLQGRRSGMGQLGSPWTREALIGEISRRASRMPAEGGPPTVPTNDPSQFDVRPGMPATPPPMIAPPGAGATFQGAGTPDDAFLGSAANNQPPAARARRPAGSAVVTPAGDAGLPGPPPDAPPQAQAQNTPTTGPDQAAQQRPDRNALPPGQRLMEFGLALLASRNPNFMGAVGEAGQQLLTQDRQRRQDAQKNRELDIAQNYREAIVNLERARQAADQNPNSPANRLRLAQAEAAMMSARAHMISAGAAAANANNARNAITPGTIFEGPNGNAWFYNARGEQVDSGQPPDAFGQQTRQSRAIAAWEQQRSAAERAAESALINLGRANPSEGMALTPDRLRAEVRKSMEAWDLLHPRPTLSRSRPTEDASTDVRQWRPPS